MKTQSNINDFIKNNAWNLLALIFIVGTFVAMINFRIGAIEAKANENSTKLDQLTDIVQRIVVLEEHDKNITQDLQEIKSEVKEINQKL